MKNAVLKFQMIIDAIELRCMAADGPVTPTLQEMTEDELSKLWHSLKEIDEFIDLVASMRDQQRKFFASIPGSRERQDALRESKMLEHRIDKIFSESKPSPQQKLF